MTAPAVLAFVTAAVLVAAPSDPAVYTAFQRTDPALSHFRVIQRLSVTVELELAIVMGSPEPLSAAMGASAWWGDKQRIGLFLQDTTNPNRVFALGSRGGFPDCSARIERVTVTDTVISCQGEKSYRGEHQKWVYDIRAKQLIRQYGYQPFTIQRGYAIPQGAVFVGTDTQSLVAVEYQAGREPEFRVLTGAAAARWTSKVKTSTGTMGVEAKRFLSIDPEENPLPPGNPSLPGTSWDQFAAARPARVSNGYRRESSHISDTIGRWQRDGERIWFAKTFYDGEGETGVGGFGWFDTAVRTLHMIEAPLLADWSVWALNVAPDAIWMALGHNGEYGGSPGGLVRYDRNTGTFRSVPLADSVRSLIRVGDVVAAGTELGIAIVDGGDAKRYFVDRTSDGRLRVAEATR